MLGLGLGANKLRKAGGLVTPDSFAGLALWLEGDAATINGGGATPPVQIASWKSKSSDETVYTQVTSTAQPTYISDTPNHADFDGSTDFYAPSGLLSTIGTNTQGTVSFWMQPTDATPASVVNIFTFGDTSAQEGILIQQLTDGRIRAVARTTAATQWDLDTDNPIGADNTWNHVAVVQNGTAPVIYINGVAVDQAFSTSTDTTTWLNDYSNIDNIRIGCLSWAGLGNTNFFTGGLDQLLYYSQQRTSGNILGLFNSYKSTYGL